MNRREFIKILSGSATLLTGCQLSKLLLLQNPEPERYFLSLQDGDLYRVGDILQIYPSGDLLEIREIKDDNTILVASLSR